MIYCKLLWVVWGHQRSLKKWKMAIGNERLENTFEHFVWPWYVRNLNKWIFEDFGYAKLKTRYIYRYKNSFKSNVQLPLKCLVLELRQYVITKRDYGIWEYSKHLHCSRAHSREQLSILSGRLKQILHWM